MMAVLILCILIVAILIYLLAAPFYFEVNSGKHLCRVRFHKLAGARIYLTEESLFLELQFVGWHKTMDLLDRKEKKVRKVDKSPKRKRSFRFSVSKIRAVIKSFKVSKCLISMDTGDMALNGILYPWLLWLGRLTKKDIRINFNDENEIVLIVENNFYRVLRAYVFN